MDEQTISIRKGFLPLYKDLKSELEVLKAEVAAGKDDSLMISKQVASAVETLAVRIESSQLDSSTLAKELSSIVAQSIIVKNEKVENNIVTKMDMPPELMVFMQLLSQVLAKPEALRMTDFRPHDQNVISDDLGYYGFVHPSGAWYIVMNEKDHQSYAFGLSEYNWDNHLGKVNYKRLDEAFGEAVSV